MEDVEAAALASHGGLPEYDDPPVVEVALAVEFKHSMEIRSLDLVPLTIAWSDLLPHAKERSLQSRKGYIHDDELLDALFGIEETASYPPRLWMHNDAGDQVVQVQHDRLVVNWLKREGQYPRYVSIRERLRDSWERLVGVCGELGLDEPIPYLCEAQYINQLGPDQGWSSPEDTARLIALWRGLEDGGYLPRNHLSSFSFHCHFPEQREGSLSIDGFCSGDPETEMKMTMNLTAHGRALSEDFESALEFMDYAHIWIVEGFTAITTEIAHDIWGRTR